MSYAGGTLGDFTGTGLGPIVVLPESSEIVVSISGTFNGTVGILCSFDGVEFIEFASVNMPGLVPDTVGVTLPPIHSLQAECTAFVSGEINVRFGARGLVASNLLHAISS